MNKTDIINALQPSPTTCIERQRRVSPMQTCLAYITGLQAFVASFEEQSSVRLLHSKTLNPESYM